MTKRKLIHYLIAPSIAIPASALTDSRNLSIYGVANLSYDWITNGTSTAGLSGVTNNKVSSNASHIGFKGSEE